MFIEDFVKAITETARNERKYYHLTLGNAISFLEKQPDYLTVKFNTNAPDNYPCGLISYRGYYEDLAIESSANPIKVNFFLSMLKSALNETFCGYKGGDFIMGEDTLLWRDEYGNSNNIAIIDIQEIDNEIIIFTSKLDRG